MCSAILTPGCFTTILVDVALPEHIYLCVNLPLHAYTCTNPCTRTYAVLNRRKNGPQDEVTDAHLSKPVFTLVWEIVKMMVDCVLVLPIVMFWLIASVCSDFSWDWHPMLCIISTKLYVFSSYFTILHKCMLPQSPAHAAIDSRCVRPRRESGACHFVLLQVLSENVRA